MIIPFPKLSPSVTFVGVFSLFVIAAITTDHSFSYNKTRNLSSSDGDVLPSNSVDLLPAVTIRESTNFSPEEVTSALTSGNINMFLVETESPFFLCTVPKTGSSLFKALAIKANGGPDMFVALDDKKKYRPHMSKTTRNHNMRNLPKESAKDLLSRIPRVLITRNPYERHISAYFDFLTRNFKNKNKSLEEGLETVSFEDYTEMVTKYNFKGYDFIPSHHTQSISKVSSYEETNYNYVFRLEEMDLWFPTFVKDFGLEKAIEEIHEDGGDFYHQSTDPDSTAISQRAFEIVGKQPWKGERPETNHQRNSADRLFEYYTPELARKVFNKFREDFEHFGYPAWDGNPATFHYT